MEAPKRGKKSDAQKLDDAREGYNRRPASQPVAGAFGDHKPKRESDQDVALKKSNLKTDKPSH